MRPVVSSAQEYFAAMLEGFKLTDMAKIDQYAQVIFKAWQDQKRVFVFGNGGSAYIASHHVTDYVKTAAVKGRRRLEAISLVDNMGLTTALGNDIGYEETFRYVLQTMGKPGDVAVAISSSGNSMNVVNATQWARDNGLYTVALTGFAGGKVGPLAHLHINCGCDNYGVIEDVHMSIGHVAAQGLFTRVSAATAS